MDGLFITKPALIFRKMDAVCYYLSLLRVYEINHGKNINNTNDIILIIDEKSRSSPNNILKKFGKYILIYEFSIERYTFDRKINYKFDCCEMKKNIYYSFLVPGKNEKIKTLYYSCNKKCSEMEENWKKCYNDYLKTESHFTNFIDNSNNLYTPNNTDPFNVNTEPFYETNVNTDIYNGAHIMLCGGNQVYSDDILKLDCVINYFNNKNKNYDNKEIEKFYFDLYIEYMTTSCYSDLLSSIPRICVINDHEIFDGYGSYTNNIQSLDIIKDIFKIGYQYYLLFQHNLLQSDEEEKKKHDYFGKDGYNKIYRLDNIIIVALDFIAEKSIISMYDNDTYIILKEKIKEIKNKYQHYIFMISSPLIYPYNDDISFAILEEKCKLSFPFKSIYKISKSGYVYNSWGCVGNLMEKENLIYLMTMLKNNENSNIIILSGDSNQGGLSKYEYNNCIIKQIMCSGIGCKIDNNILINLIKKHAEKNNKKIDNNNEINKKVTEYIKINHDFFINERNWCYLNFYKNISTFDGIICTETKKKYNISNMIFEAKKFDCCGCFI